MTDIFSREPLVLSKAEFPDRLLTPWLEIASTTLPGVHPGRLVEWSQARCALEVLFDSLELPTPRGKSFIGHQKILGIPDWFFSLSHTKEYAGAWAIPQKLALGMGFDIELKTREISEEIFKRMHHPDDFNMGLVSHWAVKEAVYKSLPVEIQEKVWLNSIKVKRGTFEIRGFPVRGEWKIFPHDKLIVACAARLA